MKYLFMYVLTVSTLFAKPIVLDSKISNVTVYTNRAQITKEATIKVKAQKSTYIFTKIPANIDFNSIQVSALGDISINDIIIKKKFTIKTVEDGLKKLNEQQEHIKIKLSKLKDSKIRVSKQNLLVKNIIKSFTKQSSQKDNNNTIDVNKWVEVLNFQETQLSILDEKMQNFKKNEKLLLKEANYINNQLKEFNKDKFKYFYNVSVAINSNINTAVVFKLSYITYNASWTPSYDIKADVQKKKLNIIYNAKIIQHSGESWDKVNVKLSTAKPHISGNSPELLPQYIQKKVFHPYKKNEVMYDANMAYSMKSVKMKKSNSGIEKRKSEFQKVTVKDNFSAVLFELSQAINIPSDNAYHKINIMNNSYDTNFTYESVPKLSLYAYLKADIQNNGKYPLLAGPVNIYQNNVFLSKSHISNITKNGKFTISLGIDENIKVTYKHIKTFDKEKGFVNKEKTKYYEYIISIQNRKKSKIAVNIIDQFPISSHEDIIINFISPKKSKKIKISNQNIVKWNLNLNANEKIELPLKYEITHPSDMKIQETTRL